MKPRKNPLRTVVSTTPTTFKYSRMYEGSYLHTLDCGHTVRAKKSGGFPNKKRCYFCGNVESKNI